MKFAVNTRLLLPGRMEGIGWFTHEIMQRVVSRHNEDQFHFLFDRPFDKQFIYGDNVRPKVLFPPARHPLLWKWWFDYSVPGYLNKIKPDLFISPDNFCSLKTDIPTLLVIHDLAFDHYPEHMPQRSLIYLRKYQPRYAQKAKRIVTVSEFSRNDIAKRYQIDPGKIDVVYNGTSDAYHPLTPGEQEEVRAAFTNGHPYFLFVSALQPRKNVQKLMEAFDAFKKETGSATRLLIAGGHTWIRHEVEACWNGLTFKDEIRFLGHVSQSQLSQLMGSARALCYVSLFEGFGIPIADAMNADTPVICSNTSSMPEVGGEAARYIDPHSTSSITQALIDVDTNPEIRRELIEKGRAQRTKFNWDKTASEFWKSVERALDQ